MPEWLLRAVWPTPAPAPWADMTRAVLAICLPLSAALAAGKGQLGVLPAMGGLLGTLADNGGPYQTRVRRVTSATVLGGAVGLSIGSVIHGHGWLAVLALVVIAAVSGVLSAGGDIASITGLQLLVYTSLGLGPVGAIRPVWHAAAEFAAGGAWALLLTVPGWLHAPHGTEQRDVAAVYDALAAKLDAIGTASFTARRQAVTNALNTAYDELLAARTRTGGRSATTMRLVALLNVSQLIAEASTSLGLAKDRPPPLIVSTVARIADCIRDGGPPPFVPPPWNHNAGAATLRDAIADAVRVLSGDWSASGFAVRRQPAVPAFLARFIAGRVGHWFTLRLAACILMAGVVTEVLPVQRSYWVLLTVAIVFKPDYGSVLVRVLQRGLGTAVGAILGVALLMAVHGLWLLIPFAVLAGLLPLGRRWNYGLLTTFLTPLVVVLIDLQNPSGWRLAWDRLLDTLIGCAIVLVVGFAPWWRSWYAHLPGQFGVTAGRVCDYLLAALSGQTAGAGDVSLPPGGVSALSRKRRVAYRSLADLRAEFQRTMSEPPSMSRQASVWWPAVVGLEQVMDAVTAVSLAVAAGDAPPPSPTAVRSLSTVLRTACMAALAGKRPVLPEEAGGRPVLPEEAGGRPVLPEELPADPVLKPVTSAIKSLVRVLP